MEGNLQYTDLKLRVTANTRAQGLLQSVASVITDLQGQLQVVPPLLESITNPAACVCLLIFPNFWLTGTHLHLMHRKLSSIRLTAEDHKRGFGKFLLEELQPPSRMAICLHIMP